MLPLDVAFSFSVLFVWCCFSFSDVFDVAFSFRDVLDVALALAFCWMLL